MHSLLAKTYHAGRHTGAGSRSVSLAWGAMPSAGPGMRRAARSRGAVAVRDGLAGPTACCGCRATVVGGGSPGRCHRAGCGRAGASDRRRGRSRRRTPAARHPVRPRRGGAERPVRRIAGEAGRFHCPTRPRRDRFEKVDRGLDRSRDEEPLGRRGLAGIDGAVVPASMRTRREADPVWPPAPGPMSRDLLQWHQQRALSWRARDSIVVSLVLTLQPDIGRREVCRLGWR